MSKKIIVLPKHAFDNSLSKQDINDNNVESLKEKVCFISINDTINTQETPYFKNRHYNTINLFFEDIEKDTETLFGIAKAFTDEQANIIYDFLIDNHSCQLFIVHCTAGISRSGAVGEFINNFFEQNYNEFKKINPHTRPNVLVLAKLNRLLWERNR